MSGAVAGCQSSVNGWEMGLMSAAWHGDAGGHIGGLNDIQLAAPFPSYGPVLGGFFRFIPFMGDAGRRWAALGGAGRREPSNVNLNRRRSNLNESVQQPQQQPARAVSGRFQGGFRAVSHGFRADSMDVGGTFSSGAVLERFQSNFRAISMQVSLLLHTDFRAVSEQFHQYFEVVSEPHWSGFRAVLVQFQSNLGAISEQFQSNFR